MKRSAKRYLFVLSATVAICANQTVATADHHTPEPNIVLILADDLGYGDIGSYNPHSQIQTPHIDRLAQQGMRFTDAHCAPWKGAISLRVRIPPGNCCSSR